MARRNNNNINPNVPITQPRFNPSFPKTQQRFVPKSQSQNTLSNSLRQSLPEHNQSHASASSSAGDGDVASSGGVRKGSSGEWVSTRAVAAAGHSRGSFVNYLPQDEAVASGLRADEGGLDPVESQRVVDLLNRELSRLLKLSPRDFWREVASDNSLHEFLDSFLKFRSRWYDFPHRGAKGTVAGVIVGENELSRRVFMVLYRISSNRDPGALAADSLSSKDHAFLLQEKKLLDLPKLLDICAIYGHENEDLTKSLVENALKAQPKILDYLTAVTSHFLDIVHTMHHRCVSSLEALFSFKDGEDHGSRLLYTDCLEVMDFINDAIVSMDAFINAYKPAAVFFSCSVELSYGNEELLTTLTKLHDTLLPSLHQGFQINLTGGDDRMLSNIPVSLKMLSLRMVNFGWKVLDFCYLSDEVFKDRLSFPTVTKIFPAKVEDPVIRADILIQTFREINASPYAGENHSRTFLQNLEKSYHVMNKVQSLQKGGWIFMDDGQLQYLSGIMMSSLPSNIKEPPVVSTPIPSNEVEMNEDAAIMESKISQIKDLFPDYGKGFLAACLEVYNNNPEEVIQRILEGTLHEDLKCLDTSLETKPHAKSALTVNRMDKGKGKLVESTPLSLTMPLPSANTIVAGDAQPKGHSVSSSSSVGWFVRKSKNMPDHYASEDRDEKDVARTIALISQYEYEDEYDDSFDDLGLSVAESGVEEDEILTHRISSNSVKSSGIEPASATKWGSRKQPQFYVKDGKNYSYKVAGSIAVANSNEASLVRQEQAELIYGLGRGGNIPLGMVKKLAEYQGEDGIPEEAENEGEENMRDHRGRGRGRGRKGGRGGKSKESHEEQVNQSDGSEVEGKGNAGNQRGRGRRGRGSSHFRKDRAMSKHFSGVSGF